MLSKLMVEVLMAQNWFQQEEGQDVVEYALLLGLVAIAAVLGLTAAGGSIQTWWTNLSTTIAGLASS